MGYFKKHALITSIAMMLGITGCTENNRCVSSGENIECQRLRVLWERAGEENPQIIIPETENESGDEMTWQELGEMVFYTVGCCFCKPHPLAKEWIEYNRLECMWEHLEKENIQKIAFYDHILSSDFDSPEDWHPWAEITEPERIKEVLSLLCKAMKREKDKFANEDAIVGDIKRMQIITDKHKFIVPISCYRKAIRGIGWTSYELREKLRKWGLPEPK